MIGEIGADITLTIVHGCGILAQASVYGAKAARYSFIEMTKNIKQFNEDPYIKAKIERIKRESNEARKRVNICFFLRSSSCLTFHMHST